MVETFLKFLLFLFNINLFRNVQSNDDFLNVLTTTENQNLALNNMSNNSIATIATGMISIIVGIVILILFVNPMAFGICSYFDGCDKMIDKTLSHALYLDGILKKIHRREIPSSLFGQQPEKYTNDQKMLSNKQNMLNSNQHHLKKRYISELVDPLANVGIITYNHYDDSELKKNSKLLYLVK